MSPGRQGNLSSYYPPRATWFTRLFHVPGERIRRQLHLEKLSRSGDISLSNLFLGLALPGFSFFARGRGMIGILLVAAYGLSAVVFLVALGYRAGSIAFGLMISIHATSIVFLAWLWLAKERFPTR